MATYLGTSAVFEVRSTATAGNLGGGGFNPANANFISNWTATSANGNSPVISSASYSFVAGDVGAWVYVQSGTNWTPGWYQIASVSAGSATLSAAIGQAIQVSNNRFIPNTVAGCATTASPTSGVCGIDYSQQNAAQFTATTLTGATTTFTDATNPVGANWVGNFICLKSGTGVTAGWYEIVSQSGGTATIDRTAGTTFSTVTYYLGGAVSLGGSTTGITDVIFFALGSSSATSGCRTFIKGGTNITYTPNAACTALSGNASWFAVLEGYASVRGDRPLGATRPTISCGSNIFTQPSDSVFYNLQFTGTGTQVVSGHSTSAIINCKIINTSTTANRIALLASSIVSACEVVCYRGYAVSMVASASIINCYIHDSATGIDIPSGLAACNIIGNIICSNVTYAIGSSTASDLTNANILANTLYGAENILGTGYATNSGTATFNRFLNNILYGFTTAISGGAAGNNVLSDYNDFFNNTNDVTSAADWQKGANDIAVNPSFTSVTQRTGATATTTAGNHLVQSGATFQTWGITAGVDCVYISAGTGVTAGVYGILSVDSETQITVDITLTANATADKVWSITQGHNFLPTGNV